MHPCTDIIIPETQWSQAVTHQVPQEVSLKVLNLTASTTESPALRGHVRHVPKHYSAPPPLPKEQERVRGKHTDGRGRCGCRSCPQCNTGRWQPRQKLRRCLGALWHTGRWCRAVVQSGERCRGGGQREGPLWCRSQRPLSHWKWSEAGLRAEGPSDTQTSNGLGGG